MIPLRFFPLQKGDSEIGNHHWGLGRTVSFGECKGTRVFVFFSCQRFWLIFKTFIKKPSHTHLPWSKFPARRKQVKRWSQDGVPPRVLKRWWNDKRQHKNVPKILEQWKKGPKGWLGYIGDEILPSYIGHYNKPWNKDPVINHPV